MLSRGLIAMLVFRFASVLYFPPVFRAKNRTAQAPVTAQPTAA